MARKHLGTIAALDVGSSKIACFIADAESGQLEILGIGHQLSQGFRSGIVTDVKALETSILAAVHAAEEMAGETIERVLLNISGPGITSTTVPVISHLGGRPVSERELVHMMDTARAQVPMHNHEMIHCLPVAYRLDDSTGIRDPRGMVGDELEAGVHIITTSSTPLKNLAACVSRCHLDVEDFVLSPYASAFACLSDEELDLGVTLIEMGGGSTSVAVFANHHLIFTDSIPIGGIHVTTDIARGLSTSFTHAERIKALYGSVIASPSDDRENIEVPLVGEAEAGETTMIARSLLVGIIRPRVEEILEMINDKLTAAGMDNNLGRTVVFTGGASQLMGLREKAGRIFNKTIRMARPKHVKGLAEATGAAGFSTSLGMLFYALSEERLRFASGHDEPAKPAKGWGKLTRWFTDNF